MRGNAGRGEERNGAASKNREEKRKQRDGRAFDGNRVGSDRECHRGRKNFARLSKLRRQRHGARRSIVGLAAFFPVVGEGVASPREILCKSRSATLAPGRSEDGIAKPMRRERGARVRHRVAWCATPVNQAADHPAAAWWPRVDGRSFRENRRACTEDTSRSAAFNYAFLGTTTNRLLWISEERFRRLCA